MLNQPLLILLWYLSKGLFRPTRMFEPVLGGDTPDRLSSDGGADISGRHAERELSRVFSCGWWAHVDYEKLKDEESLEKRSWYLARN